MCHSDIRNVSEENCLKEKTMSLCPSNNKTNVWNHFYKFDLIHSLPKTSYP